MHNKENIDTGISMYYSINEGLDIFVKRGNN